MNRRNGIAEIVLIGLVAIFSASTFILTCYIIGTQEDVAKFALRSCIYCRASDVVTFTDVQRMYLGVLSITQYKYIILVVIFAPISVYLSKYRYRATKAWRNASFAIIVGGILFGAFFIFFSGPDVAVLRTGDEYSLRGLIRLYVNEMSIIPAVALMIFAWPNLRKKNA